MPDVQSSGRWHGSPNPAPVVPLLELPPTPVLLVSALLVSALLGSVEADPPSELLSVAIDGSDPPLDSAVLLAAVVIGLVSPSSEPHAGRRRRATAQGQGEVSIMGIRSQARWIWSSARVGMTFRASAADSLTRKDSQQTE